MKTQKGAYDYKNIQVFQRGMIMGLTKHLAQLRFKAYNMERGQALNLVVERAKSFGMEVNYNDSNLMGEKFTFEKPRKITAEQTKFGKAWLKNHFFKLDGKPRRGKNVEYVSDETLKIAKSVSRFEFIGVLAVASNYGDIVQVLPIYRTYNRKGQYFDYAPVHWGQPVIMEGN